MSIIPFGIIGALMGHYLMGIDLSILSVFGILALSGVVVNDSLVLVCAVNDLQDEGESLLEAVSRGRGEPVPRHPPHLADHILWPSPASFGKGSPGAISQAHGHISRLRHRHLLPVFIIIIIINDVRKGFRKYLGLEKVPMQ
jgi:hypothetical protein